MIREVELQKSFLPADIETIYLGGGTPSLLNLEEIQSLISSVRSNFGVIENPEITIECNPDDINPVFLQGIKNVGFNRLSIGVQSLIDEELKFMNRAHNMEQAIDSLKLSREAGFQNINVDLIFAVPGGSSERLLESIAKILEYEPEHFSTYGLTIEPKTVFGNWVSKGKLKEEDDENAAMQYELIIKTLKEAGYDHYEISNFSKPGYESLHNSNYWKGKPYLGIGPGAHSYDGSKRQFNVRNNPTYIQSLHDNIIPMEFEELTHVQKVNEFIMISLRTKWGCNLEELNTRFGVDLMETKKNYINNLVENNLAIVRKQTLVLLDKGKLIADVITEELFQE